VIAQWQIDMAARPAPPLPEIVAGSTPVTSFGDPLPASVATLGINPSSREFVGDDGLLLTGDLRRLATAESVRVAPGRELSLEQARAVDPLDRVLTSALGVGYYSGTACHLDLIQWATDPAWGQLPDPETKRLLLQEGQPHLQALLALPNLRVVVCNGRSVIDQVTRLGLCSLEEVARIERDRDTCRLVLGQCSIGVEYKSGPSTARGLDPKTASVTGTVAWSWIVGSRTTPGSWPVTVSCSRGGQTDTAQRFLSVLDTGKPG
jgi:hypothetical protein